MALPSPQTDLLNPFQYDHILHPLMHPIYRDNMGTWILLDFCVLSGVIISLIFLRYRSTNPKGKVFPPGPPSSPFFGHLFVLPRIHPWLKFTKLAAEYGNIVYLNLVGQSFVVVSSLQTLKELMDHRGSNYSDRPYLPMAGELVGFNRGLAICHYNSHWHVQRKIAKRGLDPDAIHVFRPAQEEAVAKYLWSLIERPEDFHDQLRLAAGRIMISGTYGCPMDDNTNEYLELSEKGMDIVNLTTQPGAYLVDIIPQLRYLPEWVPGASFIKQAKEFRRVVDAAIERPFEWAMKKFLNGEDVPSLLSAALSRRQATEDAAVTDYELMWSVGNLFGAGVETTMTVLLNFMLAMVYNPDIQSKAYEEIVKVLGENRLPSLDDRGDLPYINAIVKESHRWRPALPMGVPHRNLEEDVYQGYTIPKESLIIGNIWSIAREVGPEFPAGDFRPERFLSDKPPVDPMEFVFGFGRRICPGRFLADQTVFLFIVSMLATFKLSAPLDENRKPAVPQPKYSTGLTSFPIDFKCRIMPRSPKTATLISEHLH